MTGRGTTVEELVRRLYPALAAGDRDTLAALLDDDLESSFCEGMPHGGGPHDGRRATMREGWGQISRHYDVRAEPQEWIACADGRLLVRGRYRGTVRATGAPLDAEFMHLWTERDGRIVALRQLTDSAAW